MHYLEVKNLSFSYDENPVLNHISFTVDPGEFIVLTGENGAAKSTLLKNTIGLLKPQSGSVICSKVNLKGDPLVRSYIPQQIASFNAGFPSTVLELVQSGRYPRHHWFSRLTSKDNEHVKRALKSVGMWEFRHKRIGELSGGQKQRICLARMFATDPDLMVLDEPTTGMDVSNRLKFYELLRHSAHQHQKAILMVTHDFEEMEPFVDRHIQLIRKDDCQWKCFHMRS